MVWLPTRSLHRGVGCVLALTALGLWAGAAHGQRMPGSRPGWPPGANQNPGGFNPGGQGPMFKKVWRCSGCGHEIGEGDFPPAQCPFCGARIINGVGPAQPGYGAGAGNPGNGGMRGGSGPPPNAGGGPPGGWMPPNNPAPAPPPADVNPPAPPPNNGPPVPDFNQPDRGTQGPVGPSESSRMVGVVGVVILVVAGGVAGLVLLIVAAIAFYNIVISGPAKPRPARRRRRLAQEY